MSKLLAIIAGIIFPLAVLAQQTPLSSVYDDFVGKPGYTSKEIIPPQMSMAWEKDLSTDAIRKVMNDISAIRFIKTMGDEGNSRKSLWKSISNAVERAGYFDLMTVVSGEESVMMYGLKHENGNMHEFALAVRGDDEVMLITLTGNFEMSDIFSGEIMKDMMKLRENYKGECPKEF